MTTAAPGGRVLDRPEIVDDITGTGDFGVIVFDNDFNTFDEVISILQAATSCPLDEAEMETWEIHYRGKSLVHHGNQGECQRAAKVIRTIGIKVAVEEI